MRTLEFNQMENVKGGGSFCSLAVGAAIGALMGASAVASGGTSILGWATMGSVLSVYADNAFCS